MTSSARFPDWIDLSRDECAAMLRRCRVRLEGIGRRLNAVVRSFPSERASDGELGGLPYVAKDMIATGRATPSWGCATPMHHGDETASVILRLDAGGATLLGAAEMTELAYEPSGLNASRGRVVNPWSADVVSGGSSSGSAALVAAGCCFAALGSDTGGSVRIPAQCCGVTALKPSNGAIPADGTMPLAPSLDTIGILARSARDIAMLWPVVSEAPRTVVPEQITLIVLRDAIAASAPQIAEAANAALAVFAGLGFGILDRNGFPDDADHHALTIMQAEAAHAHRDILDDNRIDAVLRKRLRKGLAITAAELAAARSERDALRAKFAAHYLPSAAAVAMMPVMPIVTPAIEETDPSAPEFSAKTLYAMSRFTRFANYLGLPACALPAGFDSRGLPIAIQLIGASGAEEALLTIASRFQAVTDWHGRVPAGILADIACEQELAA